MNTQPTSAGTLLSPPPCSSFCPVCEGDGIGEADDITPSGDIRQVSVPCGYCDGTGYTGQWNGNARAVMPVLCCDCDGIGFLLNVTVEGPADNATPNQNQTL